MVSITLFTQQAFFFLACALCVNGLAIPSSSDEIVDKRSGPGFVKLDFNVNRKTGSTNNTIVKNTKRGDATSSLTNNRGYYSITLNFGSQAQPIAVDIDTGSADLWVPDSSALSGGFDSASSTTLTSTDQEFSIRYVDQSGSSGNFVLDTVAIPGGPALNQFQFADVTQTTVTQGGIFGIGPTSNEAEQNNYPNFPISLKNAGYINKNAYSIYLNDFTANSGSVIFGGIDNAKYEGNLVTRPFTQNTGVVVNLDSVTTPDGTVVTANVDGVYDTGTSITYLPDNIVSAISSSIPGSNYQYGRINLESCSAPSDQFVGYKFGDAFIKVPLSDLLLEDTDSNNIPTGQCSLGIESNENSQGDNLLGDTFLRRVYFVANFDDQTLQVAQAKYTSDSNIVAIN